MSSSEAAGRSPSIRGSSDSATTSGSTDPTRSSATFRAEPSTPSLLILAAPQLALCHHPQPRPSAYVLAGHLHPCVTVGRGIDRLRLPCFQLSRTVGVLPAFGAFTGMHPIDRAPEDRVFVVADNAVHELP